MKKLFKTCTAFALALTVIASSIGVYAVENVPQNDTTLSSSNEVQPRYSFYAWEVKSYTFYSSGYDAWRDGPSGNGPGSLSINESTTLNRSFTASITAGSTKPSEASISAAIGYTIGKSETHGTAYSITLGANEHKQIIYRPKYIIYKVYSEHAFYDQQDNRTVEDTAYTYVKVFDVWDYNWKYV